MKKTTLFSLIIILLTTGIIFSQEKKKEKKQKPDPMKNILVVKKTLPVPADLKTGFDSINGRDAIAYLRFLESDSLKGRDTGSPGYQIAAEYAASLFDSWGLKPAGDKPGPSGFRFRMGNTASKVLIRPGRSFLQMIPFKEYFESKGSAKIEWKQGNKYKAAFLIQNVDYQYRSQKSEIISAPVVFIGYGIEEKSLKYNEYKGVDVKGKIVMMLSEIPGINDSKSPLSKVKSKYRSGRGSRFGANPKRDLAIKKGAVAIIMVENSPLKRGDIAQKVINSRKTNDESPIFPGPRRSIALIGESGRMPFKSLPTVTISNETANKILKMAGSQNLEALKKKIEKDYKPASKELKGINFSITNKVETKLIKSPNVLAYIEGSDPKLKDEVIVIGAHLDHLGKRGGYIFNGADDNGSGSVGVLEIAQAFALNPKKPKRTILFALWTGEEKGLLGSRYYVSHPFFPIKKTIANINLDMISREWDRKTLKMMSRFTGTPMPNKFVEKLDLSKFISLSFDAKADYFKKFVEQNNQYVGLTIALRATKNIYSGGGGSDHMPFAFLKIPWGFFSAGFTKDFHQPSDTIKYVNEDLLKLTTRLTYLTAFSLADK